MLKVNYLYDSYILFVLLCKVTQPTLRLQFFSFFLILLTTYEMCWKDNLEFIVIFQRLSKECGIRLSHLLGWTVDLYSPMYDVSVIH